MLTSVAHCRSGGLQMLDTREPRAAVTTDPTWGSKPDGLTVVTIRESIYIYGGWAADRVWKLDVPAASWTEIHTHGSVPPARFHHAATAYKGFMLVTGGELTQGAGGFTDVEHLSYYELDLTNFEWLAVETYGKIPANRSHHTMVAFNDVVVLFGGKPVDNRQLTQRTMIEAKRAGFYDVHVLHVLSRTWNRVEMYDPASPMLWGHSCVVFRQAYLLFFGGFDVGADTAANDHPFVNSNELVEAPPAAELSNIVYILDYVSMTWRKCSPDSSKPHPLPRALHCAMTTGTQMVVIGGLVLDRVGRAVSAGDCWKWGIVDGEWHRVEFCIPMFSTKRVIASAMGDHLVVAPRMSSLFFLNVGLADSGWQHVPCTVSTTLVGVSDNLLRESTPKNGELGCAIQADHRSSAVAAANPATTGSLGSAAVPHDSSELAELRRELDVLRKKVYQREAVAPDQSDLNPRKTTVFREPSTSGTRKMHRWLSATPQLSDRLLPTASPQISGGTSATDDAQTQAEMPRTPDVQNSPPPSPNLRTSNLLRRTVTRHGGMEKPLRDEKSAQRRQQLNMLKQRLEQLRSSSTGTREELSLIKSLEVEVRKAEAAVELAELNFGEDASELSQPKEIPAVTTPLATTTAPKRESVTPRKRTLMQRFRPPNFSAVNRGGHGGDDQEQPAAAPALLPAQQKVIRPSVERPSALRETPSTPSDHAANSLRYNPGFIVQRAPSFPALSSGSALMARAEQSSDAGQISWSALDRALEGGTTTSTAGA